MEEGCPSFSREVNFFVLLTTKKRQQHATNSMRDQLMAQQLCTIGFRSVVATEEEAEEEASAKKEAESAKKEHIIGQIVEMLPKELGLMTTPFLLFVMHTTVRKANKCNKHDVDAVLFHNYSEPETTKEDLRLLDVGHLSNLLNWLQLYAGDETLGRQKSDFTTKVKATYTVKSS